MTFPNDPAMLLSVLNTKLRDFYPTLDALCDDMEADKDELIKKCAAIGYTYIPERNQFILRGRMMLETELKCMLDKETYDRLESAFTWDEVFEQVNSYYTDPYGTLKQNGITLRVRTKNGMDIIQVKTHKNADSPLQIAEEAEFDCSGIPESFSAEDVKKMTGIEVPASLLGSLTTKRHSLMYCDGVEICLDKNDYIDKTDYEIEVEYTRDRKSVV